MEPKPILGTPFLRLEDEEDILVIADLHLGLESELIKSGIKTPFLMRRKLKYLLEYIDDVDPSMVLFIGDIKHSIGKIERIEWRTLPYFFSKIAEKRRVEIVKGNHDGGLENMLRSDIVVHESGGMRMGEVGFLHGHAWPSIDLLSCRYLVLGHSHPVIEFSDELKHSVYKKTWAVYHVDPEEFLSEIVEKKVYSKSEIDKTGRSCSVERMILMPAFNDLVGGTALNREGRDLLGPLMRMKCAKDNKSETFLLDGTFIGSIEDLKS
jgi:putative SbcD/Mre11-related phosphoesterase